VRWAKMHPLGQEAKKCTSLGVGLRRLLAEPRPEGEAA
jgi:hypothetical protein